MSLKKIDNKAIKAQINEIKRKNTNENTEFQEQIRVHKKVTSKKMKKPSRKQCLMKIKKIKKIKKNKIKQNKQQLNREKRKNTKKLKSIFPDMDKNKICKYTNIFYGVKHEKLKYKTIFRIRNELVASNIENFIYLDDPISFEKIYIWKKSKAQNQFIKQFRWIHKQSNDYNQKNKLQKQIKAQRHVEDRKFSFYLNAYNNIGKTSSKKELRKIMEERARTLEDWLKLYYLITLDNNEKQRIKNIIITKVSNKKLYTKAFVYFAEKEFDEFIEPMLTVIKDSDVKLIDVDILNNYSKKYSQYSTEFENAKSQCLNREQRIMRLSGKNGQLKQFNEMKKNWNNNMSKLEKRKMLKTMRKVATTFGQYQWICRRVESQCKENCLKKLCEMAKTYEEWIFIRDNTTNGSALWKGANEKSRERLRM